MLNLSRVSLASGDDIRRGLTAAEGKVARGVEDRERLEAELCDAKLNLELMEDWKGRITNVNEKAAAALSQVAEVNGKLDKVAEKHNELEGKLREVDPEPGRRLIRLNTFLVKQAHMNKVISGIIEQSVSVFDGFVNQLGGDLVNSFRVRLEKAYLENLVKCSVALTHVSGAGATSVYWR